MFCVCVCVCVSLYKLLNILRLEKYSKQKGIKEFNLHAAVLVLGWTPLAFRTTLILHSRFNKLLETFFRDF